MIGCDDMIIFYIFAVLFLMFSILFGRLTVKERSLVGKDAFKTYFIYLFFGVSMALFSIFASIKPVISVFIFIGLMWIFLINGIIERKSILLVEIDLFILTISIIFMVMYPIPENIYSLNPFSIFLLFLLLSIYFMPLMSCLDKKRDAIKKIYKCTYEISAKVYSVHYYKKRKEYICKIEFEYNDKKYKYEDSNMLCFKDEIKKGDIVPILIDPNAKKFKKNVGSVFIPGAEIKEFMSFEVKVWYISIIVIFIFILFLLLYN